MSRRHTLLSQILAVGLGLSSLLNVSSLQAEEKIKPLLVKSPSGVSFNTASGEEFNVVGCRSGPADQQWFTEN